MRINAKDEKIFINNMLKQQSNLIFDFSTLVILVIGINTLMKGIENIFNKEDLHFVLLYVIMGTLLIMIYIVIYLFYKLMHNSYNICIDAVVFKRNKEVIPIRNYVCSEDMVKFIKHASAESKDIGDICKINDFTTWKNAFEKLIRDLVEYQLLYYMELINSEITYSSIELKQVDRNILTDFVLNNKIFSLFTESTETRAAFNNKKIEKNVVSALMSTGALYERMVLKLPKNCRLRRIKNGIEFENNMFLLIIDYEFHERVCGRVLSNYFVERYAKSLVGIADNSSLKLNISFKPKISSLFSRTLEWYAWVDKYVNYIYKAFSFDCFLEQINWSILEAKEYMDDNKG